MKKVFLAFYVLLATVAASLLSSCQSTAAITAYSYSNHTEYLETDIAYPVFTGYDELNTSISTYVDELHHSWTANAATDWRELDALRKRYTPDITTPPFEFKTGSDAPLVSKRYISLLLRSWVNNGGAHGNTLLKAFTYDKKAGVCIAPTELGISYAALSAACRKRLIAAIPADSNRAERQRWIESGTEPTESALGAFTYDGETLTVYFAPYQVAPYSDGVLLVAIPVAELRASQ